MFNQLQCYRYNNLKQPTIFSVVKRKREEMNSSTPISQRREPCVLDLGEESPIEREKSSTSNSTYSASEDVVPVEKNKAGVSNELDSMLVTPPKVYHLTHMTRNWLYTRLLFLKLATTRSQNSMARMYSNWI